MDLNLRKVEGHVTCTKGNEYKTDKDKKNIATGKSFHMLKSVTSEEYRQEVVFFHCLQ